jgi:hypothetical protein
VVIFITSPGDLRLGDAELGARSGLLDGWASLMQNKAGEKREERGKEKPITLIPSLFCASQMKIILLVRIHSG